MHWYRVPETKQEALPIIQQAIHKKTEVLRCYKRIYRKGAVESICWKRTNNDVLTWKQRTVDYLSLIVWNLVTTHTLGRWHGNWRVWSTSISWFQSWWQYITINHTFSQIPLLTKWTHLPPLVVCQLYSQYSFIGILQGLSLSPNWVSIIAQYSTHRNHQNQNYILSIKKIGKKKTAALL